MAISPQVTSKIIDLSSYVQAVPSTIGFICGLTKKGEDNKLKFIGSRTELISEFGEPNIVDFGKNYGQGLYGAYNFLGESGSLYFIRSMPEDARFSNMRVDTVRESSDSTSDIQITYIGGATSKDVLKTELEVDGDIKPLGVFYPIGRGEYYNRLSIRITKHANPMFEDVYVLDLYERQSDDTEVIIESFDVSFNPYAKDDTGDSLWITYVLEQYSSILRFDQILSSENYTSGYDEISRVYDRDEGNVTVVETSGSANLTDNKQDFTNWTKDLTEANFVIIVSDDRGKEIHGWIGDLIDEEEDTIEVYNDRFTDTAIQAWAGDVENFNFDSDEFSYRIKKDISSPADAFQTSEPIPMKRGSDGSLIDNVGNIDADTANQILSQSYSGVIDEDVLDIEDVYFNLVFDCGYPNEVKGEISSMVLTRRDCVAIMDNGDNPTFNNAIDARTNDHTYNTYHVALYEGYSKIYDQFTGQDIWVSPTFHMSYLLPRNDNVAEIWWAAAGLQRGAIQTIEELRYNPRLGQRDQLYLSQLNPIVKFNEGYTVWGQLTSQAKPSALQDLNIVRLVLYVKRAFEQFSRFYIFEQNDAITHSAVQSEMVDFLEQIKRARGLYGYSVNVYSTDYMRKRKTFAADIELDPTRVTEKIDLNFFIK